MGTRAPYTEVRIKLPTFAVLLIRQMIRKANARDKSLPKWTMSLLLERWLLDALTVDEMRSAANAPGFKQAAEAWLKLTKRRLK